MAMGSSTSPRVQSASHLCVQTRPQTAGNGLGSLATRVGLGETCPSRDQGHVALRADVCTAQARLQGAWPSLSTA